MTPSQPSDTLTGIPKLSTVLLAVCLLAGCDSRSTTSATGEGKPEASLEEVNQALATWYTFKASYPTNLSELESAPFFKKKLPTPPPGRRLIFDPNTRRALFVPE